MTKLALHGCANRLPYNAVMGELAAVRMPGICPVAVATKSVFDRT